MGGRMSVNKAAVISRAGRRSSNEALGFSVYAGAGTGKPVLPRCPGDCSSSLDAERSQAYHLA